MPVVRLFAQARQAAGTSRAELRGATVAEVLESARTTFGAGFVEVLPVCGIWVNGEPAGLDAPVREGDEVAVLPPVSGGAVDVPGTSARTAAGARRAPARAPARKGSAAATDRSPGRPGPARSTAGGSSAPRGGPTPVPSGIDRLLPRPVTSGPRVRVGVLWFLLALAAATAGRWATGVLWAAVAAVAATELVRTWRSAVRRPGQDDAASPVPLLAGVGAAAVPLAGAMGTGLAGLVLVLVSGGSYVASQVLRREGRTAAELSLATVFPAVVATAVVLTVRAELWSGLFLLVAVSLYDAGNYLMGADSRSRIEGPVAGIVGVAAVTFTMAAFQPPPFDTATAWIVGGLVAVACPLGQALTNALLPTGAESVPAVRRLDAYAVAAPVVLGATWLLA